MRVIPFYFFFLADTKGSEEITDFINDANYKPKVAFFLSFEGYGMFIKW